MTLTPDHIRQKINQVRELKLRSIHDCANVLGISNEDYLKLEQGSASWTLSDLELLSVFFGTPLHIFFQIDPINDESTSVLGDSIRPRFIKLNNKIISAKMSLEMQKQAVTLEDIHFKTGIPLEALQAYETGQVAIPIDHLLKICDFLDLPVELFFHQEQPPDDRTDNQQSKTDWQADRSISAPELENQESNSYNLLVAAMKSMPMEEQAQIAKFLLDKLKTL